MTSVIDHLLEQPIAFLVASAPSARSPREAVEVVGLPAMDLVRTEMVVTRSGPVAVVVRDVDAVDLNLVRRAVRDDDVRLASLAEIRTFALDCVPGSLPPLSRYLMAPVYVDEAVQALRQVVFPGGIPSALVSVHRDVLFRGHPASVAPLTRSGEGSSNVAPSRRIVLHETGLVPFHEREG